MKVDEKSRCARAAADRYMHARKQIHACTLPSMFESEPLVSLVSVATLDTMGKVTTQTKKAPKVKTSKRMQKTDSLLNVTQEDFAETVQDWMSEIFGMDVAVENVKKR